MVFHETAFELGLKWRKCTGPCCCDAVSRTGRAPDPRCARRPPPREPLPREGSRSKSAMPSKGVRRRQTPGASRVHAHSRIGRFERDVACDEQARAGAGVGAHLRLPPTASTTSIKQNEMRNSPTAAAPQPASPGTVTTYLQPGCVTTSRAIQSRKDPRRAARKLREHVEECIPTRNAPEPEEGQRDRRVDVRAGALPPRRVNGGSPWRP